MAWNCNVCMDIRDMHIMVTYTGTDIADVAVMREQTVVLAEEYSLHVVPQSEREWITPGRVPGEFVRHLRVAAYPYSNLSLAD